MIACPRCKGTGQGGVAFVSSRTGHFTTETVCNICLGTGNVSTQVGDWVLLGITPARLSAMENGRADPAMLENSK